MALTVTELKAMDFSRLSLAEKLKIIQRGRPIPDIYIAQSGVSHKKRYIRTFSSEWYNKKNWLCGCEIRNTLFCYPCLLMGGDSVWTDAGFSGINRISERTLKHENSRQHIDNVVGLSLLGRVNIAKFQSESYRQTIIKHNESVIENRRILSKIIDCLKLCGKFELPLCGHDETEDALNPGVFKGLVNFSSDLDLELKMHLNSNSIFKGKLKLIQNDILDCVLQICREQIMTEINETSFVAVMAEDTTDVSECTQMAIVFRYVLNDEIHERFWGLFNPENVEADGLSKCILDQIDFISIILKDKSSKLVAQTFDGANVMRGDKSVVQCKIKEKYKNAHFIHCHAHQLDLIMKNAASTSANCRAFFASLSAIPEFFSYSPNRLKCLNKYIIDHLPRPSATRWNFKIRTVKKVYQNQEKLRQCFQELKLSPENTDETIKDSADLLNTLNDDNFLFWLELFHKLMPHVELIYNRMQSSDIDAYSIKNNLESFTNAILQIRDSYGEFSSSQSREAEDMCDVIIKDIKDRYNFSNQLIAVKLFNKENFPKYRKKMPIEDIKLTVESYPMLDKEKLESQLEVFYSRTELHNFNGLLTLLKSFSAINLCEVLEELTKLIKILITTPMTTAEPERCFSTIKRIKTYIRNKMEGERLTALSMLSIENKMIVSNQNFNEKVIDLFAEKEERRADFSKDSSNYEHRLFSDVDSASATESKESLDSLKCSTSTSSDRPFKCEICGTSFKIQSNMNRHKLIQCKLGKKPFVCRIKPSSLNKLFSGSSATESIESSAKPDVCQKQNETSHDEHKPKFEKVQLNVEEKNNLFDETIVKIEYDPDVNLYSELNTTSTSKLEYVANVKEEKESHFYDC